MSPGSKIILEATIYVILNDAFAPRETEACVKITSLENLRRRKKKKKL